MRYVLTVAAFVGTLWLVGIAAVFAVISFAGPHSGPISKPMELLVYGLACISVLVIPVIAARSVWRRMSGRDA